MYVCVYIYIYIMYVYIYPMLPPKKVCDIQGPSAIPRSSVSEDSSWHAQRKRLVRSTAVPKGAAFTGMIWDVIHPTRRQRVDFKIYI